MGGKEMSEALGITPAMVCKLSKRGMPLSSPQAAQAWREVNAPPRQWKAKSGQPSPKVNPAPATSTTAPQAAPEMDGPQESLRRAKLAEKRAFQNLEVIQKDKLASPEDLRKSSSTYFSARANRQKAEMDFRQWQRDSHQTLFYEEAVDIAGRPHEAVRNMLSVAAKTLAPRLVSRSQKDIENTLADWIDRLTETLRSSL